MNWQGCKRDIYVKRCVREAAYMLEELALKQQQLRVIQRREELVQSCDCQRDARQVRVAIPASIYHRSGPRPAMSPQKPARNSWYFGSISLQVMPAKNIIRKNTSPRRPVVEIVWQKNPPTPPFALPYRVLPSNTSLPRFGILGFGTWMLTSLQMSQIRTTFSGLW
jgi:hypothetical protein